MLVEPFLLSIPEADLVDLHERLARVRWPDRETVEGNQQGPQLTRLQELVARWREGYDWRPTEHLLNGLGQYRTTIDGLEIAFLHVRSPEPGAVPLLMTHGWPGSVLEFRHVIGPLTDPAAHGGDPADAFHLVLPTLPGFGFTQHPAGPGWNLARTAEAWIELMDRLGYPEYFAQGGDLGAGVTDEIAARNPSGLRGIHLNFAMFRPTPEEHAEATAAEKQMLADADYFWANLSGYAAEQSTRPQTIGYSLADSPTGLAAWIYSLIQDTAGTVPPLDEVLDNIMLYWLPNSGTSAARMYWEMVQAHWSSPAGIEHPITVPTGVAMAPREHVRKSERWVARRYTNLVHFAELPEGGHFTAWEQPHLLVDDLRTTFRGLR
ncbi:epoxide hydrolase family protein [Cryptosporangium sp. NPDC051539]|uniref:epoxide hydrolase family protein n=1 Tax=Cryptosporangium sp. NPDC051539 TaxID=3363962 RepID=UPI0037B88547